MKVRRAASLTHWSNSLRNRSVIQRRGILFGSGDKFWEQYKNDLVSQDEVDNPSLDRRVLSESECRNKFGLSEEQYVVLPNFEFHSNMWYTSNHMFVQQTNLDDVWRLGFSPIRWTGYRHVEWVKFQCEDKDKILYSMPLMHFSISHSYNLGIIGQSLSDVEFIMQCPFHKAQVLSVNTRFRDNPQSLISNDEKYEYKWCLSLKYIMDIHKIFETPPIVDGRYGKWYDAEQYEQWVKEEGLYKEWQMHQMKLQWETGSQDWKQRMRDNKHYNVLSHAFLPNFDPKTGERLRTSESPGGKQRYLSLDESLKNQSKSSIKPNWWPW